MISFILPLTLSFVITYKYNSESCPKINTVENFNLTEYINGKWYIQKQQETTNV